MTRPKLTLLNVRIGCGEFLETVFLSVRYIDGEIDWDDACDVVQRYCGPQWWPDRRGRANEFNRRAAPPAE